MDRQDHRDKEVRLVKEESLELKEKEVHLDHQDEQVLEEKMVSSYVLI